MALIRNTPRTTPIDDIFGLKQKTLASRKELNFAEAQNILNATQKYFSGRRLTDDIAPFTLSWALQLHREMFGEVWEWAGQIRLTPTNVGDLKVAEPGQIEQQLYDLFECLKYWKDETLFKQAAMLHHRGVCIHPFKDGNGRWARMLANIWMVKNNGPPTIWPPELTGTTSPIRDEYLKAIRAADLGDYTNLATMHELNREVPPSGQVAMNLAAEALTLETQVSDLVNAAYNLTPEEIALMWQTAPPRMPIAGPAS